MKISTLFRRRRALVVDPSLVDQSGHHLNVALAIKAALSPVGWHARFLAHRDWDNQTAPELAASPVFSERCYKMLYHTIEQPTLIDASRRKAAIELSHFLSDAAEKVIIFPTVTHLDLYAIAKWVEVHPDPKTISILFWVLFSPEFMTDTEAEAEDVYQCYEAAFAAINALSKTGAVMKPIVETPGMRDVWQPLSDAEISVIRLPSMAHAVKSSRQDRRQQADVRIGFAGEVNEGKGFSLLPEAIRACLSEEPKLHFDIRVNVVDPAEFALPLDQLDAMDQVSLFVGQQTTEAYLKFLAGCSCILLPYDPDVYAVRGSTICEEAHIFGIPVVAPASASFAKAGLEAGAVTGIPEHTATSIAQTVLEAVRNADTVHDAAARYARTLDNQNDAFVDLVETSFSRR